MSEAKKYTAAKEKLAAELKATVTREDFRLLESHVCAALTEFCRQSEAFADAVLESEKKLSDCTASLVSSGARCLDAREAYMACALVHGGASERAAVVEGDEKPCDVHKPCGRSRERAVRIGIRDRRCDRACRGGQGGACARMAGARL